MERYDGYSYGYETDFTVRVGVVRFSCRTQVERYDSYSYGYETDFTVRVGVVRFNCRNTCKGSDQREVLERGSGFGVRGLGG